MIMPFTNPSGSTSSDTRGGAGSWFRWGGGGGGGGSGGGGSGSMG